MKIFKKEYFFKYLKNIELSFLMYAFERRFESLHNTCNCDSILFAKTFSLLSSYCI